MDTSSFLTIVQSVARLFCGHKERFLVDFKNKEDLEAWYDLHKELRMPAPNLCDDYSRESRALAEVDGYFLSCCLVSKGKCYEAAIFTLPDGSADSSVFHVGSMAILQEEQECWYVDLAWGKLMKLCDFIHGGKY